MPHPALIGLGISLGSGILGGLLGGKSPAEERLESILAELDKSFVAQGLSQAERANLLEQATKSITRRAATQKARTSASLARRGVKSPGILAGANVRIGSQAAADVSEAERGILSSHLEIARRRYDDLRRQATTLAGSIPEDDIFGTLGQLGQNIGMFTSTEQPDLSQNPLQGTGTLGSGGFNRGGFLTPESYLPPQFRRDPRI